MLQRSLPQSLLTNVTVGDCPASLQVQPAGIRVPLFATAWRKVSLQAAALFTQATGTQNPEQDLCLVYLADVLPEQMGKGNESLSHFCLAVPLPIHHFRTYHHGMAPA